jgi:ketosteroid isomerase-like protein
MSQENVELVRRLYAAIECRDMTQVLEIWDPQVEWREAEGHPYADGNPYLGPEQILEGVFSRLGGEWEGFTAHPQEYLDAGDVVVVLGRYTGTYKETGRVLDAQIAHVYRLRDGRVVAFQQYTDTAQFLAVTGKGL